MKKIIWIVISLTAIMCGCSNVESSQETTETIIPETSTHIFPTEDTEPITEPAEKVIIEEQLLVYPLNVGMAYYNYAQEVPDLVYNTLGSENGLAGTIYTVEGTVTEIVSLAAAGVDMEYAKVETDRGMVLILNSFHGIYKETVARYGEKTASNMYSDNPAYYVFPPIGERAQFLVVYSGYSQKEDMPSFDYGASADIFQINEQSDPVAAELDEYLASLKNNE